MFAVLRYVRQSRDVLFQQLNRRREQSALRFADQQMHVFRHDYVPVDTHPVPPSNAFKDLKEEIPQRGLAEKRPPFRTTEGKEMVVMRFLVTLQSGGHARNATTVV